MLACQQRTGWDEVVDLARTGECGVTSGTVVLGNCRKTRPSGIRDVIWVHAQSEIARTRALFRLFLR